jgi:hypothetical protein
MTPEELDAESLRPQAEASTNPMMQPTNLIGQQAPQEAGTDTNTTQDGTLIGVPDFNAPYIYPEAAQAFKGVEFNMPFNPLDSNPQISATIDEPVKNSEFSGTGGNSYSPFGGLGTSSTTDTGQLRLNNLIDNIKDQNQRIAQSSYSPFGGMSTASTALQNRSGFGGKVEEVAGEVLSNLSDEAIIGRLAAASGSVEPESVEMVTPESVSNLSVNGIDVEAPISSIEAAKSQAAPGSPQAFFEDYRSQGPLTPEQIARGEVAAARMGTTFDPETGFSRDAYLAGQADPGPMGVDATRARLGGMTLNQYLNAPDGTEGVYGLRTDPQGRMIPGGAPGTSQTRADAYGQYEDEVSQAYQRQSNRIQQLADQRDGTAGPRTYGGYTTSQLRGMVGGGDNLRAAQMRAEAGLNPVTGNREKTEEERAQSSEQGQLQNEALRARIDVLKQSNPDKVKEAEDAAARMGLEGRAATIFTLGKMGINTETIFDILEASKQGGGGGGGSFTEAQQSSISKVMAANPGSSREQIIAEMKKQGKL